MDEAVAVQEFEQAANLRDEIKSLESRGRGNEMSKWYIDKGEQGDIVLSTRIRLARNLDEFPFRRSSTPRAGRK